MRRIRVIPVLLLKNGGLVKSIQFKRYNYVGDALNAVRIFNNKEVDELIVLDIDATREGRGPDLKLISDIASEAFIPLAYGGGITTIEQIQELFYIGVEKIILNHSAYSNISLVTEASNLVGSQSVVVSVDVNKSLWGGYKVVLLNGKVNARVDLFEYVKKLEKAGAGEIFLNSINNDGTFNGYDLDLVKKVSNIVSIPVIACGGARSLEDFRNAVKAGASAVAAGSFFVFQRPHRAVLISYPTQADLVQHIYSHF